MKSARHAMILDIIDRENVETQEELAALLKNIGVMVTQATVSRDIKELRLIKVLSDNGRYKYATVDKAEAGLKARLKGIFVHSVISVTSAGNLVIVKTVSGAANAATEAIDNFKWDEVAGTIAGDNTIFIAVRDVSHVKTVMDRFGELLK